LTVLVALLKAVLVTVLVLVLMPAISPMHRRIVPARAVARIVIRLSRLPTSAIIRGVSLVGISLVVVAWLGVALIAVALVLLRRMRPIVGRRRRVLRGLLRRWCLTSVAAAELRERIAASDQAGKLGERVAGLLARPRRLSRAPIRIVG